MNGVFFHDRIVLLQFNALSGVFPVFGSDVPAHAWQAAGLVLCALQNYLYAISFFGHGCKILDGKGPVCPGVFQYRWDAFLVDGFNSLSG